MLTEVIGIRAIHNDRLSFRRDRGQPRPKLGLTVVAPVRRIGGVMRVGELVSLDDQDGDAEPLGDKTGGGPLGVGVRGTAANNREDPIRPERLDRYAREVRRVDTAAIPDNNRPRSTEAGDQALLFAERAQIRSYSATARGSSTPPECR